MLRALSYLLAIWITSTVECPTVKFFVHLKKWAVNFLTDSPEFDTYSGYELVAGLVRCVFSHSLACLC